MVSRMPYRHILIHYIVNDAYRHSMTTAMLMQHHCNSIAAPLQRECSTTAKGIQHHCKSMAVTLQKQCVNIQKNESISLLFQRYRSSCTGRRLHLLPDILMNGSVCAAVLILYAFCLHLINKIVYICKSRCIA